MLKKIQKVALPLNNQETLKYCHDRPKNCSKFVPQI